MVQTAFCISYVPLLRGQPGVNLSEEARRDPGHLRQLLSAAVSGLANGCAWVMHDDRAVPVFVFDRGTEIFDHLVEWAEYDPPAWFRLYFAELPVGANEPPGYLVALQPRIDRSVERFRRSFPPGLLNQTAIEVVFSPLYHISSSKTYQALRERIGGTSYLGILDASDFDPQKPEQFDPQMIRQLGPFAVGDMAELGGVAAFLEGVIKPPI